MPVKTPPPPITFREHVVYTCSRLLAYGLPLLFFMVVCSFYLKTYDSAQVKITFTQIGALFLLFVWLTKILVEGRSPFQRADLVYVAPFIAYLVSDLVAFGHAPYKGWILEETLRRVMYMVFALLAIVELRTEERISRLWRWLIAAAWVTIGYGILQFVDSRFFPVASGSGIDPFIWRQAFGTRVFSTFGNPNFYGNFLVIITPMILASVLRAKGSLTRPFIVLGIMIFMVACIELLTGTIGGPPSGSESFLLGVAVFILLAAFVTSTVWRVGPSGSVPFLLILFAWLALNLYATETKGAWVGFTAAMAATMLLILEYFLNLEERQVAAPRYAGLVATLGVLFALVGVFFVWAFIIPIFKGTVQQTGFKILWVPAVLGMLAAVATLGWVMRKPWNLKKLIYGFLLLFVLGVGGVILQYAKDRLFSVSFRVFTWISTWEMIHTHPVLGNGVGSFKVIYPAFRRPEIIVLEAKSNTETDHAEDEYLETWQDEGIIGFGIFLWMVITALVCGFKQLRWYSRARAPDRSRKLLDVSSDKRSYEVLGFLGAYIGVLFHWAMDVSVRFVSSGIFSGLLPGILVAYARNHENPVPVEARLSYDRWIRAGLAAFWTGVMLYLRMELVPAVFIRNGDTSDGQIIFFAVLMGALVFLALEALEWGLVPAKEVPFHDQYPPAKPAGFLPRMAALACAFVGSVYAFQFFANGFFGDVHHNLAIFFSKQAIWEKAPKYEAQVNQLPFDLRKAYIEYGGALEHYHQVEVRNPYFPMARYFTGNVYNDRGSQMYGDSVNARNHGDLPEAERLRDRALAQWDLAEKAYDSTRELGPNYVQTLHQLGLLYIKRAELYRDWGRPDDSKKAFATAEHYLHLYHLIDPVFPPNYDRLVQILLLDNRFKEAEQLYEEALYYSDQVTQKIRKERFLDRITDLALNLGRVYVMDATHASKDPFNPPSPDILKAEGYFKESVEADPKNVEAWKALASVLDRMGQKAEAQDALRHALAANPQDPQIRGTR